MPTVTTRSSAPPVWLAFVGLVLLALNLRPAVADVGPILDILGAGVPLGPAEQSILTSLPVLCFGIFAAVAPAVTRRFGLHGTSGLVIAVATIGLWARMLAPTDVVFLGATAVVMAALGVGNVIAPTLAKRDFPHHGGVATAAYTTTLTLGITGASFVSAPLALAFDWRAALLPAAITATVALVPWVVLARAARRRPRTPSVPISLRQLVRTRTGWAFAAFFACQGGMAFAIIGWLPTVYQAAGLDHVRAGAMAGLLNVVGLALAFPIPAYLGRHPRAYWVIGAIGACGLAGFAGLALAPAGAPELWAGLIAVGLAGFPVFLSLLSARTRTPAGTSALSGFANSVGFLLAAPIPALSRLLQVATGSWTAPILAWMGLTVVLVVLGVVAMRGGTLEDELDAAAAVRTNAEGTLARIPGPATDDGSTHP